MFDDPLVFMPVNGWGDLKLAFKSDWPRSISGFMALETEEYILNYGLDYGFKVYCPYGDVNNGMVAHNVKNTFYEVIIQCPKDDTRELEEALRKTKIIEWNKCQLIPYAPQHIMDCVKRLYLEMNYKIDRITMTETFVLDKKAPLFNVRLPADLTFDLISLDDVQMVNDKWPYKYADSDWCYELLIKAKLGYGLYNGKELLSWVFLKEMGALGHLYTLEKHRRKGYAELVTKLASNLLLKDDKYVVVYCITGNWNAANLYTKLGFKIIDEVGWIFK